MADANALARSAVEALVEDETVRGDLTDAGFGPLLDWATAALTAAATAAAAADAAAAESQMSGAADQVKATLATAVRAAQSRRRADALALVRDPLIARSLKARSRVGLAALRLGADADANATRLASALRGVQP